MVTAKITAKPGEKNKIVSKAQNLIQSTRLESGCISYNLYNETENNNTLLMLEKWENQDVLNLHMQTEHFKAFNTAIGNILAKEVDIAIYSINEL
jgi:Uncharacterized conserved protein